MAKRDRSTADIVLDAPDLTLLDVIDTLLNRGVMADGDLTLGVAGIDLVYLRLSAMLCAVDRLLPATLDEPKRQPRRRPRGAKHRT
jgi:hypothetical protein